MKDKEPAAIRVVRGIEGGNVDDKRDKGGRTGNGGITQPVYDAYRKSRKLPKQDVWKITEAEISAIYDQNYWDKVKADELPAGLDLVLFDGAIHSGPRQSVIWLQKALGSLYKGSIDGSIGVATMEALRQVNDHDALIGRILDMRLAFLKRLTSWGTYKRGWTSRLNQIEKIGQAWATGSVGPVPVFAEGAAQPATIADAKPPISKGVSDAVGVGGGGSNIAAAAALQTAKDQLEPYATTSVYIGYIVAGLAVLGVALLGGGFAYRAWANRQNAKRKEALGLDEVGANA